jgi:thiopurine S-methyltransferase
MERSFWQARWDQGSIGFHLDGVNPALSANWTAVVGDRSVAGSRVLVPLCGKSQDLVWLREQGHEVVGVEFVEEAARAFFAELGVAPTRDETQSGPRYAAPGIEIYVGDFLKVQEADCGRCDWVYDRAACVAIRPEKRREYVSKLASLAQAGAGLLLISFEHDIGSGPPFSIPPDEVAALFGQYFQLQTLSATNQLDAEPRFRERGATFMNEQCYLGLRK